jgi:hypothetical protein
MEMLTGTTSKGQEIANREKAADAPFLSAGFWKPGVAITGEVVSVHNSSNGPYIAVELFPSTFEHETLGTYTTLSFVELPDADGNWRDFSVVRIGNLAGLGLARRAALAEQKDKRFVVGDRLQILCTGITPATKEGYSDSPNFELGIVPSPARVF